MKKVQLSLVEWEGVCYAMEGKIRRLKRVGLRMEAEDLEIIKNKIEKQIR